jgi:hypothetical protein
MSTRKEKMWELFFMVRSPPSFEDMWKEFLAGCGTDASATIYQHITDIISRIMSEQFPVAGTREMVANASLPYSRKVWQGFKFGDLVNLVQIAKLKIHQLNLTHARLWR